MEFCGFDLICWREFLFSYDFAIAFLPELLATFIGAVLGVLAAIGVRNWFDRRTEKEGKAKILSTLRIELQDNRRWLVEWVKNYRGDPFETGALSLRLSDENWIAFSEGGELGWIKEPSLRLAFASAYTAIRTCKGLSERYFQLVYIGESPLGEVAVENYFSMLDERVNSTAENIKVFLDVIERHFPNEIDKSL